jgi:ribonuclease P protein component
VVRNKIKRRIRHLFRSKRKNGYFAVIAKSDISEINYKELVDDVEKVVNKIN